MSLKNFKKNQVVIFVIALMLVSAGYLNYKNQNKSVYSNLLPTSSLADSEEMASIGDATLVNAKEIKENKKADNNKKDNKENNEDKIEKKKENNTNEEKYDGYFKQSKLDREKMYSQNLENYQKILETNNISIEDKSFAQKEILKINKEKNAIMIAENLIKTKGFEDVILFINNGNVTIVVKSEKLEQQQIAQIDNIVTRELNVKTNKINISNKK